MGFAMERVPGSNGNKKIHGHFGRLRKIYGFQADTLIGPADIAGADIS